MNLTRIRRYQARLFTGNQALRGSMSVFRINQYQALEGKAEALEQVLRAMQELLRSAKGCRSYRISQDIGDPSLFSIFEEWDSLNEHMEASRLVSAELIEAAVPLLRGRPEGRYFQNFESE